MSRKLNVLYTALFAIALGLISAFSAKAAPVAQELVVTEVAIGTPVQLVQTSNGNMASIAATSNDETSDLVEIILYSRDKNEFQLKLIEMARSADFSVTVEFNLWMTDGNGRTIDGTSSTGKATLDGDDINISPRIRGPIVQGNKIHSRSKVNGISLPPLDFEIGDESHIRLSISITGCRVTGYYFVDPWLRFILGGNVYAAEHLTDQSGTTQGEYILPSDQKVITIILEAYQDSDLTKFMGAVAATIDNPCYSPPVTETPQPNTPTPVLPPPPSPSPSPIPTNPPHEEPCVGKCNLVFLPGVAAEKKPQQPPPDEPPPPVCIPSLTATFVNDQNQIVTLEDGDKWYSDTDDKAGQVSWREELTLTINAMCVDRVDFYSFYPIAAADLPVGTSEETLVWDAVYHYSVPLNNGAVTIPLHPGRFGFGYKPVIHAENWMDNVSFQINVQDGDYVFPDLIVMNYVRR